jgi:hypothetical protein
VDGCQNSRVGKIVEYLEEEEEEEEEEMVVTIERVMTR